MSWLGRVFGGNQVVSGVEAVGGVLDSLFTSDDERLTHEEVLTRLAQRPGELQTAINQTEAQHKSVFVAGWRPFCGWVCGVSLAYNFIVRDILAWLMTIYAPDTMPPPELAMEYLMTVLMGMLGMGTLRTVERVQGRIR